MPRRIFQRNYSLEFEDVRIRPERRVAFEVHKSSIGSYNTGTFRVWDIPRPDRLKVQFDQIDRVAGVNLKPLVFTCGYGDLGVVFRGTIARGTIQRSGQDLISTLHVIDGSPDFFNARISATLDSPQQVVDEVIKNFTLVKKGYISNDAFIENKAPIVVSGNALEEVRRVLKPGATAKFINNELVITSRDDVINAGETYPVITARAGMVSVPERDNNIVKVRTLINPDIEVNKGVILRSTQYPDLNGTYKIQSSVYVGDYEGGPDAWQQTLTMFRFRPNETLVQL